MQSNNWDKTLTAIQAMTFFKCESSKVAEATNRTSKEARAALINELYLKRLRELDPREVRKMVDTDNYWLRTRITYSRKGLINQYLKRLKNETEVDIENISNTKEQPNQYDVQQAIRLVPKIFPNKRTAQIIISTLQVGELETREKYNLSKRQYYRKIGDIERYCAKHRQEIRQLIPNTEKQQRLANRLKKLKLIDKLIKQGDNSVVQQLIYSDMTFWENEIAEIPEVKYQYYLIHDYANSKDKQALTNYVSQEITKLENQIKGAK
jgi:glycerophosphoryl diester phosphodiesterase